MTEDNSPENLRKFLGSDDPAMVRMGLSMAKGAGVPEEMHGLVAGLYMWHDDKTVRAAAKSTFMKQAPDELKTLLKKVWNTSYRTRQHTDSWFCEECNQPRTNRLKSCCVRFLRVNFLDRLIEGLKNTTLDNVFLWIPPITSDINWKIKDNIIKIIVKHYPSEAEAVPALIKALKRRREADPNMAAWALSEIGKPAVEPLIRALKDELYCSYRRSTSWNYLFGSRTWSSSWPTVRYTAVYSVLGDIGDTRAVEPLINELGDKDEEVRNHAVVALGKIGDARAVGPLIKALGDENEYICINAKEALKKLGHEVE